MIQRLFFPSFRRFARADLKFKRRFTPTGRLLLLGIILTAVFGIDTEQSMVYQLFVFLLILLVYASFAAAFFKCNITAKRVLPRIATDKTEFTYEIILVNNSKHRQRALYVFEDLEDPWPTLDEFLQAREPGEKQRNWFDRQMAFHRFIWLTSQKCGINIHQAIVNNIMPNQILHVKMTATPKRRGIIHFTGITVARTDPFGIFLAFHRIAASESLLVLPKRYPLPLDFHLPGGRLYQQGGETLAMSIGESEEFVSLRDYRDGDSMRHIHWPSFAKRGKPIVKEYQDEYFTRHALVLDTFLINATTDAFEEAIAIAASFAVTLESADSLLDLLFVSPNAFRFSCGRGLAHAEQMLEILASVTPCYDKSFTTLSALVLNHASVFCSVILLCVAWDESHQELVRQLVSRNIQVAVFIVTTQNSTLPSPVGLAGIRFHVLQTGRIAEGLAEL